MSNRIQPTHFIEVYKFNGSENINYDTCQLIKHKETNIFLNADLCCKTIALFLIRKKTPQEKANSIYYPKPTTK